MNHIINVHKNDVSMFVLWSDLKDLYNKFDFYEAGFKGKNPIKLSVDFPDLHFNYSGSDLVARIIYGKLKVIKDRFMNNKLVKNIPKDEVVELLKPMLGPIKGKGNPLLQFKTLPKLKGEVHVFENHMIFADPLHFERSWLPFLHKKTGPVGEQRIYKFLTFFYLWKDYFDSMVTVVLNDNPTIAFVRALTKVYEENNEKEKLDQLKVKFY